LPLPNLAGCGAQPAPELFGITRKDITREGRQYTVFHKEKRAEVSRLVRAQDGEHQAIRATMIALIP